MNKTKMLMGHFVNLMHISVVSPVEPRENGLLGFDVHMSNGLVINITGDSANDVQVEYNALLLDMRMVQQ